MLTSSIELGQVNSGEEKSVAPVAISYPDHQGDVDQLDPFLKWVYWSLLKSYTTCLERAAQLLGVMCGMITGYYAYPLAADFGGLVADAWNADSEAVTFLRGLSGTIAFAPFAILQAVLTQRLFKTIAAHMVNPGVFPGRADAIVGRRIIKTFTTIFSTVCGLGFYAVSKKNLGDEIGTVVGAFGVLCGWALTSSANSQLVDRIYNYFLNEADDVKTARHHLRERISALTNKIKNINDVQIIDDLHDGMFGQDANDYSNANAYKKIHDLFGIVSEEEVVLTDYQQAANHLSCCQIILKIALHLIAAVIALSSVYVMRPYAELTADWLFGEDDYYEFKEFLAFSSLFQNALFVYVYFEKKLESFCQAISDRACPSVAAVIAQTIAACSAISNTYVAIIAASDALSYYLVAATFLAPAVVRSLTFQAFLTQGVQFLSHLCQKSKPETKRAALTGIGEGISQSLDSLNHDQLIKLNTALSRSPNALFARQEAKHDEEKGIGNRNTMGALSA